jgi:hypothetical protein
VMENGLVGPSVDGTPQGGPLSPLLSNLVLDELDRELERPGTPLRALRGRLQHLRPERPSGSPGDGSRDAIPRHAAQAHGQCVEKCGGASAGADVSRLHLLRRPNGRSRDCAEGRQAVQDEGTGDHATGQRRQRGDHDSGTGSVSPGLAKLFRLLRNARGAGVPHALGPLATASGAVATVFERYMRYDGRQNNPGAFTVTDLPQKGKNLAIGETWVISPNLINEFSSDTSCGTSCAIVIAPARTKHAITVVFTRCLFIRALVCAV